MDGEHDRRELVRDDRSVQPEVFDGDNEVSMANDACVRVLACMCVRACSPACTCTCEACCDAPALLSRYKKPSRSDLPID